MFFRVGLIGFGLGGRVFHAPLIDAQPDLRLTHIVSGRSEAIRAAYPAVQIPATAAELLADPAVDLVVICTPNTSHYPLAEQALRAGKHVVVDKPFTVTTAEADALIRLARAHGRLLSVFHNRRWDGGFLTAQQLVKSGQLGAVWQYEAHFDRLRPEVRDRWRERPEPGSGVFYDLGSHLIDQAVQLFGKPEGLTADLASQRPDATADDYFHLVLRYGKRRVILHGSSLIADPPFHLAVHGDRGSYVKQGLDPQEAQLSAGLRPGDAGYGEEAVEQAGRLTTLTADGALVAHSEPTQPGAYQQFYAGIAAALRTGAPPPVTAEEARCVIALLEAGLRSHRDGRQIGRAEGGW